MGKGVDGFGFGIHNETTNEVHFKVDGEEEIRRLNSELDAANERIARLNDQIDELNDELAETNYELDRTKSLSGLDEMETKLNKFEQTARQTASEFKAFLTMANLSNEDGRFNGIFAQIADGSLTASQAITKVKTEWSHLIDLSGGSNGGALDSGMIASFSATLETLSATVSELSSRMSELGAGGGGGSGGGGNLSETLTRIAISAESADEETRGAYESIAKLVTSLNDFAGIDAGALSGISQAFKNIAAIGQGSFGTKSVNNIVYLIQQLQALSSKGVSTIHFDLSGFENLNVRKTSLNNLATYLPQLAKINVGALDKLSKVDLTNFNNIKVSKGSIEAIANLAESLRELKNVQGASASSDSGGITVGVANGINEVADATMRLNSETKRTGETFEETTKKYSTADKVYSQTIKTRTDAQDKASKEIINTTNYEQERINKEKEAAAEQKHISEESAAWAWKEAQERKAASKVTASGYRELANERKEATREERENLKAVADMERAEEQEQKRLAQDRAKGEAATRKGAEAYRNIAQSLNEFTRAQNSNKPGSQEAYATLQKNQAALDKLASLYQRGKITGEGYARAVTNLNERNKESNFILEQNGENVKTFGDRLSETVKKFSAWFSTTRIIMAAYRAVKQMIQASIELDSAFTQLQIVTKASDETMAHFADTIGDSAKRIGSSITDLTNSATVFARLGYSLNESAKLAEYSTMLQNVANIDSSAASDAITAILKAYSSEIDIDNIESVMDKLVEVGNNYPISTAQIAEGMNNASSALAAANNSFEESVALLTAANTTIQNAAKASTGIRTITARLRNTKADLEELGEDMTTSKYEDLVKALTDANVALRDTNGEYRSTYDIMVDIAKQWDNMTDMEQSALVTEVAGVRMQSVFLSIVQNIQEATGAMDSMSNSAGALTTAYDIYLDSAQGKINQFKATFQDLAQNVVKSDWIEDVVEGARWLIEALNGILGVLTKIIDALGGLKVVIPVITGLIARATILKSIRTVSSSLSGLQKIILLGTMGVKDASAALTAMGGDLTMVTAEMDAAQLKTMGFSTAMGNLGKGIAAWFKSGGWVALVIAAIALISKFIDSIQEKAKRAAEEAKEKFVTAKSELSEATAEFEELTKKVAEYKERISELEELDNPTFVDEEELEKLRESVSLLEREKDLQGKRKNSAEENVRSSFVNSAESWLNTKSGDLFEALGIEAAWAGDIPKAIEQDGSRWRKYKSKISGFDSAGEFWKRFFLRAATWGISDQFMTDTTYEISPQQIIDDAKDALGDLQTAYSDALKSGNADAAKAAKAQLEAYENYLGGMLDDIAELTNGIEWIPNPTTENQKNANEYLRFLRNVEDYFNILLDKTGGAKLDAFSRIIGQYGVTNEEDFWSEFESGSDIALAITEDMEAVGLSVDDVRALFDFLAQRGKDDLETVDGAVKSLKGSLEKLSGATSGLNTLDKIFTDIANGNGFDFSSLVDSGFIETFGQFTDEFNQFIWTVSNSPDDIDACRSAFTNLTKAYLRQLGVTDELNEDTQKTIVGFLNSMGVQATLIESLERVAIAKHDVISKKIITDSDVQNLINEANAAGATAASLERLQKVKTLLADPKYQAVGSQQWMAVQNYAKTILNEPLAYEKLKIDDFIGEYTGGSSYQSYLDSEAKAAEKAESAAEKSAEKAKTWFDIQLAEHKHRVQMEQETEAQYLAWLDKAYKRAYAEGIHDLDEYRKYEEEVYDGRQKLAENAQSALDKLVDYRKKMLEQEVSDQKDALKEQLDALKDFYDKQKEMLQDSFDEEDYLRDQEEKRKSVTDIELKLAQIRGDDSAAAAKRRAELNQQLKEAKEELTDFERDHARDAATKLLDDEYAKQEEAINAKIDSLDEKYKSAKELYEEALRDIKSGSVSLYQEMIAWNAEYGDGIDDTITSAWENAYKALQDYKTLYGSMFGGANLANATGYRYPSGGGYASGTSWAIPGLRGIDEAGSETIFESSNGRKYKMFSGGEKVLNARASDFLYRFANGGSQLLEKFVQKVTGKVPEGIGSRVQTNAIEMGDIIIQGNADRETISQIRREQRKAVDFMLKEINSLSY